MSARARLATVGTAVSAVVLAGHLTSPQQPEPPAPQQVPVLAGSAACPDVRQEGARGSTSVAAVGGTTRAGGPLDGPAVPALPPDLSGPYVVRAEGAGLLVEQTTRATTGSRRGTASVACSPPVTQAWFVGGGTVVGSYTELVLVNSGDVPALVDVRLWTADGPVDGRGFAVRARTRAVVALDTVAPDRDLLALHVRATRGQVSPALRVVRSDGRTPLGTDWVPPTEPPSREAVVPGLPQGPGRRTALLSNPGEQDAAAELVLVTGDGEVPLDPVVVPAGTSVAVDLSERLAETPGALRVRADVPVLAGASVVDRQDGPVREIAYASAAPAFEQPAVLADVRLSAPTEVTLLLTAGEQDAVVDVVPLEAPGDLPEPRRVEVPAGTTVATRLSRFLPPGSEGSLVLEVRPVRGRVHAARYSRERGRGGPLTTLLPVVPPPRTVLQPAVVADPAAGL